MVPVRMNNRWAISVRAEPCPTTLKAVMACQEFTYNLLSINSACLIFHTPSEHSAVTLNSRGGVIFGLLFPVYLYFFCLHKHSCPVIASMSGHLLPLEECTAASFYAKDNFAYPTLSSNLFLNVLRIPQSWVFKKNISLCIASSSIPRTALFILHKHPRKGDAPHSFCPI